MQVHRRKQIWTLSPFLATTRLMFWGNFCCLTGKKKAKLTPAGIAKIQITYDTKDWSLSVGRERWDPYHMPWEFTSRRKYTANWIGEKWFPTEKKNCWYGGVGRKKFLWGGGLLWKRGDLEQDKETQKWGWMIKMVRRALWWEKYLKR